jgi:taurine dioxygenase
MSPQDDHSIALTPLTPVLGVEVHGLDLSQPLPDAEYRQLNAALAEYGVLLLRGQDISPEHHVDFSRRFGEIDIHVLQEYQLPGHPEVFVISNVVENGRHIGAYGGAKLFHSDLSYNPEPSLGSLFLCRERPPAGGQTEFAGMFAAYDALPEDRKQWLLKQRGVHDYVYHYQTHLTHRKPLTDEQKSRLSPTSHPAVRTHPASGRNAIYVSEPLTSHFEGMDVEEGRRLIKEISDFASQPEFIYRHEWQVGDLVFWDNRSTMHRVLPFDESKHRRIMHRTTVKGDRPFLRT